MSNSLAELISRQKFWLSQVRARAVEISHELALEACSVDRFKSSRLEGSKLSELEATIEEVSLRAEMSSKPAGDKPWWIVPGIRKLSRLFLPAMYFNVIALRTTSRNLEYAVNTLPERNVTLERSLELLRKSLFRLETGPQVTMLARVRLIESQIPWNKSRAHAIANANKIVPVADGMWKHQQQSLYQFSETFQWMKWQQASVQGQGLVLAEGGALFPHEGLAPWNFHYPGSDRFFLSQDKPDSLKFVAEEGKQSFLSEAVLVTSRAPGNWFHWWLEVMSNINCVKDEFSSKIPIIVSGAVPGFDFAPKSFQEIARAYVENPIIYAHAKQRFFVDKLHTRSPAIAVSDDFDFGMKKSVLSFSLTDLENLRESSLQKARNVKFRKHEKVFFLRGPGARSLNDELGIIGIAQEYGFHVVNPAQMSWIEQIALVRDAKVVAGSGGAVMANYLFASEGTAIVQFVSEQNVSFSAPAILGQASGSQVFSIVGQSEPISDFPAQPNWRNSYAGLLHHANFSVPREQAREGLGRIINNLA